MVFSYQLNSYLDIGNRVGTLPSQNFFTKRRIKKTKKP